MELKKKKHFTPKKEDNFLMKLFRSLPLFPNYKRFI